MKIWAIRGQIDETSMFQKLLAWTSLCTYAEEVDGDEGGYDFHMYAETRYVVNTLPDGTIQISTPSIDESGIKQVLDLSVIEELHESSPIVFIGSVNTNGNDSSYGDLLSNANLFTLVKSGGRTSLVSKEGVEVEKGVNFTAFAISVKHPVIELYTLSFNTDLVNIESDTFENDTPDRSIRVMSRGEVYQSCIDYIFRPRLVTEGVKIGDNVWANKAEIRLFDYLGGEIANPKDFVVTTNLKGSWKDGGYIVEFNPNQTAGYLRIALDYSSMDELNPAFDKDILSNYTKNQQGIILDKDKFTQNVVPQELINFQFNLMKP